MELSIEKDSSVNNNYKTTVVPKKSSMGQTLNQSSHVSQS